MNVTTRRRPQSANSTVHLLLAADRHTTGRYFERAFAEVGSSVSTAWNASTHRLIQRDDLVLYVDPGPRRLPLGLESLPCRTACYLIDVHQELETRMQIASFFDLVFVAQNDYVESFRSRGMNAHWLPLACEPETHFVPGLPRDIDVGFVGKLGLRGSQRFDRLREVLPRFETNDYETYYAPADMGRTYSRSKIVFNASINGDLNMRVFEAMASGALLVTDRIGNGLDTLFEEGRHYVAYSAGSEAVATIRRFLDDDDARKRIAEAGHAEVFARHTYAHRMERLLQLSQSAEPGSRPARVLPKSELALLYATVLEKRGDLAGIVDAAITYGRATTMAVSLARALGRAVNRKVPLTPNAVRYRFRSSKRF